MPFYWLILGILATWRITHLLQSELGPWNIVTHLRGWIGKGFLGELFDCFHCLSIWVAAPFAYLIGEGWKEVFLLWLAMSAGSILLEEITNKGQ